MKVWLTNGRIAWQIPSGHIASLYLRGAYQVPEGWQVKPATTAGAALRVVQKEGSVRK